LNHLHYFISFTILILTILVVIFYYQQILFEHFYEVVINFLIRSINLTNPLIRFNFIIKHQFFNHFDQIILEGY